jgi:hypothetical protein
MRAWLFGCDPVTVEKIVARYAAMFLPYIDAFRAGRARVLLLAAVGTELEFVIMVIAVSCVKLLSAHNFHTTYEPEA